MKKSNRTCGGLFYPATSTAGKVWGILFIASAIICVFIIPLSVSLNKQFSPKSESELHARYEIDIVNEIEHYYTNSYTLNGSFITFVDVTTNKEMTLPYKYVDEIKEQ